MKSVLPIIFLSLSAVITISADKVLRNKELDKQLAFNQKQNEEVVQEPRPLNVPSMILDNPVQGKNPKQWICRLIVYSIKPDGRHVQWTGSAFKVKISPNVGRTVLFTAAHIICKGHIGEYVNSVDVQCPGEAQVRVVRNSDQDMWMPNEFLNTRDCDHDYAYLTYPGISNTGFGWQGFLDATSMIVMRKNLVTCGYLSQQDTTSCISDHRHPHVNQPSQQTPGQYLHCSRGDLDRINENTVYAKVEISLGQSGGGPLYDASGTNYIVYGIVSLPSSGCLTSQKFNRLTAEKLYNMFSHMGGLHMAYRIRSSESPNVSLHMDGVGLDALNRVGGNVYAGYRNNVDNILMIFPIQQTSSNQHNSQLMAIRSSKQRNVYLRMDGTGFVATQLRGGGMVNCRFGIDNGEKEVFHKEVEPDGQVAFRSKTYNDVYLRIDRWTVSGPADRGTVNAQFGKFTQEVHHLEPLDLFV